MLFVCKELGGKEMSIWFGDGREEKSYFFSLGLGNKD